MVLVLGLSFCFFAKQQILEVRLSIYFDCWDLKTMTKLEPYSQKLFFFVKYYLKKKIKKKKERKISVCKALDTVKSKTENAECFVPCEAQAWYCKAVLPVKSK